MSLIDPNDLKIEYWPLRQQGGQQVTLTSSGIRVEHIPTGIVAICEFCRSQHANRTIAISMIEEALTNPMIGK